MDLKNNNFAHTEENVNLITAGPDWYPRMHSGIADAVVYLGFDNSVRFTNYESKFGVLNFTPVASPAGDKFMACSVWDDRKSCWIMLAVVPHVDWVNAFLTATGVIRRDIRPPEPRYR